MPKSSIPLITPILSLPKSFPKEASKFLSCRLEQVESFASKEDSASSKAEQPNASLANGPAWSMLEQNAIIPHLETNP